MLRLAVVLSLVAWGASAQDHAPSVKAASKSALDAATLEKYLRHLELWPPQIQVTVDPPQPFVRGLSQVHVHLVSGPASKDVTYYVSADGKTVIRGSAHQIDRSPFQDELDQLKTANRASFGPQNAPLTLVVFSDFECPLCREEARELRQKAPVEFPRELRVVFTDFPLEAIHPWARTAAIAGRCVYRENTAEFWSYHDWIFEHQAEIKADNLRAKVLEWAKSRHQDSNQLTSCMDTRATDAEVAAELAQGKRLAVDSTPTSFLNGRPLVGQVPWQNLSQIIKLELEFQKTSR